MIGTLLAVFLSSAASAAARPAPEIRLAEVTGEVRVELPRPADFGKPLPWLPPGTRVSVLSGNARLDVELPGTLWLNEGDEIVLDKALKDPRGRHGLLIECRQGLVEVEAGPASLLLEAGDGMVLRTLPLGQVGVEAAYGHIEAGAPGWQGVIIPGQSVAFHSDGRGYSLAPLDVAKMAIERRVGVSTDIFVMRAEHAALALPSSSERAEEDLRSAVGPVSPLRAPARGYWPPPPETARPAAPRGTGEREWVSRLGGKVGPAPEKRIERTSPRPGPIAQAGEGETGTAIEDPVAAAGFIIVGILLAGWWWARRNA